MPRPVDVPCRIVAEREVDSPLWTFYLVNDDEAALLSGELVAVRYEWAEQYHGGASPGVCIAELGPGARAPIWRDDGGSEMRTDLWLEVTHQGRSAWLLFEFPKLYRQSGSLLVAHPQAVDGPPEPLPRA